MFPALASFRATLLPSCSKKARNFRFLVKRCPLISVCFRQSCVHTFAGTDCIKPMMQAMKSRPDQIGRACEALHQMFAKDQSPQLMKQVRETVGTVFQTGSGSAKCEPRSAGVAIARHRSLFANKAHGFVMTSTIYRRTRLASTLLTPSLLQIPTCSPRRQRRGGVD